MNTLPIAAALFSIAALFTEPLHAQTYSVSGTAQLQDTSDYSGITVEIYRGPVQDTMTTDAFGDYYFTGLTFGRYYFRFTRDGYIPAELAGIEIADNMFLQTVTLDTIPDTTHISGRALLAGAASHAGITVRAAGGTVYDTTDTAGTYTFPVLSGTELLLAFSYPGFATDTLDTVTVHGPAYGMADVTLDSAYLVAGTARYGNTNQHDGITVSAYTADSSFFGTVTTDDTGAYAFTLPDSGIYSLRYTAPGYLPIASDEQVTVHRMRLSAVTLDTVPPGTTFYGGLLDRDTRWTTASERHIREDFTVPAGITLTIEAGTHVYVAPTDSAVAGTDIHRIEFRVLGRLDCRGTAADPVTFASESGSPAAGDWRGIEILDGADTCRITHTTVKHGFWGVYASGAAGLLLDSCRLTANANGFDVTGTPFLMDEVIVVSNSSAAGNVTDCRFAVTGCRFMNNGSNGPGFHGGRGAVFNCLVYANQGTRGVTITDSVDIVLCNNTIVGNGNYGIDANRARAVIINTVINGHTSYGINNSTQAYGAGIEIAYNCLWSNGHNFRNCPDTLLGILSTSNANGDTVDGRYNLFFTPGVTNVHEDLHLSNTSKCRGAGTACFYSVQLDDTVKVYNREGGLPHIGRDMYMASAMTFDTAYTDTPDTHTAVERPQPDVTDAVYTFPRPAGSFAELAAALPVQSYVYTAAGRCMGTLGSMDTGATAGVYVVLVPRGDGLTPVRVTVLRP